MHILVPWKILARIVRSLALALSRGLPLRHYLSCGVIGVLLSSLSPREIQYLSPSTRETYKSWIQKMATRAKAQQPEDAADRLRCDIEELDDGKSALLWIGNRSTARKFVLCFHGGGYIFPMLPGFMEWYWRAYVTAGIETGVETAVAVLEYSLCPNATYPTQLRQAVSGLSKLLSSGISPSDIIIGGDSAGGNLAAQLLYHLAQPHADLLPIALSEPLAGAFMVSPLLSSKTDFLSFKENDGIDMLSVRHIRNATKDLFGNDNIEPGKDLTDQQKSAFPLEMSPETFRGISTVTRKLYITAGQHEVLRDQAREFADEVKQGNPNMEVRVDIQPTQAHDFILLEGEARTTGECMLSMKDWTKGLILGE